MNDPDLLLASLLALIASIAFGVSGVFTKRGLAYAPPLTGTFVAVGVSLLAYTLTAPFWMRADDWFTLGFWIFAIVGIIQPGLSMYLANEAYQRAGATIAATFSATAPLFAAALAIAFLDERITLAIAAGTLLTVLGIVALSWTPRASGLQRLVASALVFASFTAAIRGLNHVVAKFGIDLLPNVFMASFSSYLVSFLLLAIACRWRDGQWLRLPPRAGLAYFSSTGLCIALGSGMLFAALLLGKVVVVSPIVGTYPVFTLIASVLVGDEPLRGRVVGGVALVVVGVVCIGLYAGG